MKHIHRVDLTPEQLRLIIDLLESKRNSKARWIANVASAGIKVDDNDLLQYKAVDELLSELDAQYWNAKA